MYVITKKNSDGEDVYLQLFYNDTTLRVYIVEKNNALRFYSRREAERIKSLMLKYGDKTAVVKEVD